MNKSRCALVIFEDDLDNVLLYLRDNKLNIPFPNTWGLIGGLLDEEETPEQGIKREVKEEIGLQNGTVCELQDYEFLFTSLRKDIARTEYVFRAPLIEKVENLVLHEGQRLELFSQSSIKNTDSVVPHHKEILLRYFELKS